MHLREEPQYPRDGARRYGDIFLKAVELLDTGDREGAIQLWRSYLKENPHEYFRTMAEENLRRIDAGRDAGV